MSKVCLDKIEGSKLYVFDIEVIDGTPLLDINYYVTQI